MVEATESRLCDNLQNSLKEEVEEFLKETVLNKITSEEVQQRIQNEVDGLRKEFHSGKNSRDISQRTHDTLAKFKNWGRMNGEF